MRPAVGLLSASAIAYQLLLIRLFSIAQSYHFAFMVISLALLGYGASGAFIAVARRRLRGRLGPVFAAGAGGFALLAPGCWALVQRLPFNPLEIAWSPRQAGLLALVYLLLAVPFFFAATAIGLALVELGGDVHRLYRADLVGAGCGALLVTAALFALPAERCLVLVGSVAWLAAVTAAFDARGALPGRAASTLLAAAALSPFWPVASLAPRMSEFKSLARARLVPGTKVLAESSGPLALLTVLSSERVPLRFAPGLSLLAPHEPPEQLGLFTDGDAMSAIHRVTGRPGELAFLDYLPTALPYWLLDRPRVALIGAGGGGELVAALHHGAAAVEVVEEDPRRIELLENALADYSGRVFDDRRVRVRIGGGRGALRAARQPFDLLLLPVAGAGAGGLTVDEGYLFTREALEEYLEVLAEEGFLAFVGSLRVPPRAALRLLGTAAEALERRGIEHPERHLAMVRSWDVFTFLVKRGELTPRDLSTIRAFADSRALDLAWIPGMTPDEANRRHLLERPYLFDGARALLGPARLDFLRRYKFDVEPVTDDRPYFFDFFRWSSLPELVALPARGGAAMVEWGYLILAATLAQAVLAGLLFILLPVRLMAPETLRGATARWVGVYFLALGLAFLFVEIAFLQRLMLFVSDPLYAAAVVLGSFLVFAGLGSGASQPCSVRYGSERVVRGAVAGITLLAILYLALLPPLLGRLMALPVGIKGAVAVTLLGPLAFLMGMPFPLGLRRVAGMGGNEVPWAWAVNGWGSVVSPVLATLIAIHFGFRIVVLAAAGLYVIAALAYSRLDGST